MGALGHEVVVQHEQRVDRLLRARRAQAVAGQGLGRGDGRSGVAEHLANRLHLLDVAHRRGGAVRVQIVDLSPAQAFHGQAHAAHGALARGSDHVIAVGIGGVADDLAIDLRPAGLGALHLLQDQHARAAGDDEAVAGLVIGAAGDGGAVVEVGAHGAHGVEQDRQRPVQLLGPAGEHDVLLAHLDLLVGRADAVGRGGARRRDAEVQPADLRATGARRLGRLDDHLGGRAARADDQAGLLVAHLVGREAGVGDRLLHGDVAEGRALGQEPRGAAVDHRLPVDVRLAVHLAAEAELGIFRRGRDAGPGLAQGGQDFVGVVADG